MRMKVLGPERPNQTKTDGRWLWISDCCVTSSQLRKNYIWPVQPSVWASSNRLCRVRCATWKTSLAYSCSTAAHV